MRCANCGNLIMTAKVLMFNNDGSDRWVSVPLEEVLDNSDNPDHAVIMDVSTNWTGDGLTEEEQIETIRCPNCGKFPFGCKEIHTVEILRIVCFKD